MTVISDIAKPSLSSDENGGRGGGDLEGVSFLGGNLHVFRWFYKQWFFLMEQKVETLVMDESGKGGG